MNLENKFGEYWKKFLEYWQVFLTHCSVYWEKAKEYAKKAADFLCRHGKELWEKLSVYAGKAKEALKKYWSILCRHCRRLLQMMAAWLLTVREKAQPKLQQAKEWCVGIMARLPALQKKEQEALPPVEEPLALEQSAEAETETVEETVEEAPAEKELPQWMSIPWVAKTLAVLGIVGTGIKVAVKWIWKLRKVIMAIPVVWYAVKFAMENADRLPEEVGLDIQSTGEFATMISRQEAVWWPLGITLMCLVLMFCSKKPVLPWVVSIFTLVLPWLIWLLNYYA